MVVQDLKTTIYRGVDFCYIIVYIVYTSEDDPSNGKHGGWVLLSQHPPPLIFLLTCFPMKVILRMISVSII